MVVETEVPVTLVKVIVFIGVQTVTESIKVSTEISSYPDNNRASTFHASTSLAPSSEFQLRFR